MCPIDWLRYFILRLSCTQKRVINKYVVRKGRHFHSFRPYCIIAQVPTPETLQASSGSACNVNRLTWFATSERGDTVVGTLVFFFL